MYFEHHFSNQNNKILQSCLIVYPLNYDTLLSLILKLQLQCLTVFIIFNAHYRCLDLILLLVKPTCFIADSSILLIWLDLYSVRLPSLLLSLMFFCLHVSVFVSLPLLSRFPPPFILTDSLLGCCRGLNKKVENPACVEELISERREKGSQNYSYPTGGVLRFLFCWNPKINTPI